MQRVSLLLCVLPLLTSSRWADAKLQKKLSVPKLWKTCKNIKCPPTEDPVCVKIKFMNREMSNKTTYIYMVNECELEYMKCHQDAEAVIVPDKHCEHNRKSSLSKAHKRLKRELKKKSLSKSNVTNTSIVSKAGQKKIVHRNKTASALRSGYEDNTDTENDDERRPQGNTDTENDDERRPQDNTDTENDDDRRPQASDRGPEQLGYRDDEDTPNSDDVEDNNAETKFSNDDNTDTDYRARGKEDVNIAASESDDKKYGSDVVSKNNDVECPTQCEIRGVMVCGKCQHGIYRTFLSPCHMRMFMCNNDDEELELMSRYPCVLSVPYAQPMKGLLKEPHDVDDVLRFIYCREARELGSKKIIDPRCAPLQQMSSVGYND